MQASCDWSHRTHSYLGMKIQQHVCHVSAQGRILETQCPRFLLWSGHISILCLALSKFQTPRRRPLFSINQLDCKHSPGTMNHPHQLGQVFCFEKMKVFIGQMLQYYGRNLTGSRLIKLTLNVKKSLNKIGSKADIRIL